MNQEKKVAPRKLKPVHLSPSEGWFVAYALSNKPFFALKRVITFALLQEPDGSVAVDGIDSSLELCQTFRTGNVEGTDRLAFPHFMGFYHERDLTPELREDLAKSALSYGQEGAA